MNTVREIVVKNIKEHFTDIGDFNFDRIPDRLEFDKTIRRKVKITKEGLKKAEREHKELLDYLNS